MATVINLGPDPSSPAGIGATLGAAGTQAITTAIQDKQRALLAQGMQAMAQAGSRKGAITLATRFAALHPELAKYMPQMLKTAVDLYPTPSYSTFAIKGPDGKVTQKVLDKASVGTYLAQHPGSSLTVKPSNVTYVNLKTGDVKQGTSDQAPGPGYVPASGASVLINKEKADTQSGYDAARLNQGQAALGLSNQRLGLAKQNAARSSSTAQKNALSTLHQQLVKDTAIILTDPASMGLDTTQVVGALNSAYQNAVRAINSGEDFGHASAAAQQTLQHIIGNMLHAAPAPATKPDPGWMQQRLQQLKSLLGEGVNAAAGLLPASPTISSPTITGPINR